MLNFLNLLNLLNFMNSSFKIRYKITKKKSNMQLFNEKKLISVQKNIYSLRIFG